MEPVPAKSNIARPPAISDKASEIALEYVKTNEFRSSGVQGQMGKKKVAEVLALALREDNRRNQTGNANSQYSVSSKATNRWMKRYLVSDSNSKHRNNHTTRAQMDLGNGIAQYMVLKAIMEGTATGGKDLQSTTVFDGGNWKFVNYRRSLSFYDMVLYEYIYIYIYIYIYTAKSPGPCTHSKLKLELG